MIAIDTGYSPYDSFHRTSAHPVTAAPEHFMVSRQCALTDPASSAHGSTSFQAYDPLPVDPTNPELACDDWCHAWTAHTAVVNLTHTSLTRTDASLNFEKQVNAHIVPRI
jgi:hypothetical protein